ncbi:hypothetical protein IKF84_02980 [Candidatus Saccharibacteria bacterium]|nr:hypothetical protein [Candidatus Saccharibacteria bacterium]
MLSTIKSPEEVVDTFDDAKRNGTVPEGVRDKQDYEEYKQEQNAKLNDAQKLIWETYYDENRIQERSGYKDRIMSFMGSEDLKVVVKSGFNLEDLFKDGILSKADGRYLDSPIPGLAKSLALDDTEKIIGDLAGFCEVASGERDSGILFNEMKGIFDAWSDNNLDADQYEMISDWLTPNSNLWKRLMYGETISEDGFTSRTIQVNRTLHLIDTLQEIEENYGATGMALDLYNDKIKTRPGEIDYYTHNDIKSAFGEVAHGMFDSFLNESDINGTAREIIKSVITSDNLDLVKKAKEETDCWDSEPVFTDEELLSSIYGIDPSDKTEKLYGRKEVANRLPRHFADLEKAGFSRDSLLNIIHDKNVPVHAEEVERMREAGVSNADIAYASRAYERFVVDKNGEREWYDAIDDDLLERKKEGYDPAFGLSDTDILNAANRNYWRNERMNNDADER